MSPTTSPFGPLAVLVDARAGNGAVEREVDAVERALTARGLSYRLHVAPDPASLSVLSAAALDQGYRFLAAVGDDATVQDVVNGMFRDGRPIVEEACSGWWAPTRRAICRSASGYRATSTARSATSQGPTPTPWT